MCRGASNQKKISRGFSGDRTHDLLLTRETLLPLSHEAKLNYGGIKNYCI
jgi:hypothetical protein